MNEDYINLMINEQIIKFNILSNLVYITRKVFLCIDDVF